jgi:hypothetical protein
LKPKESDKSGIENFSEPSAKAWCNVKSCRFCNDDYEFRPRRQEAPVEHLIVRNRIRGMDVGELDMVDIISWHEELRRLVEQADKHMVKEVEMMFEIRRKVSIMKLGRGKEDKKRGPGRPKKAQASQSNQGNMDAFVNRS